MRLYKIGLVLLFWVFAATVQAELKFPALSGRVVDDAQLIEPATRARLSDELQAHEQATGEQVVVVTLANLQGASIEDFGYRLGRHWGIGQKDKNNGALLIVARDEHKLRIEVGYGLEDRLTDAQASVIINQVMVPAFKSGQFSKGIDDGVSAMLLVLGGTPLDEPATAYGNAQGQEQGDFVERHPLLFIFLVLLFILSMMVAQMLGILPSGGGRGGSGGFGGGGFGGGSSGGGGFSGGGGSFGGGGSSGSW
ncbi:TPM domain-containing protein [Pseudomonas sp. MSSRFD41]|uniref:TPM domain-containing protein n=1 Tax=unclassified Pseudomonas TaxID=196821 RepID=UPI00163A955E|nr:TPM domain-containing protein [Pseudomonas sp. MSSRFD41]MBC2655296.1 TPM domain-containing protein [Pseudomonas sp. MSSRFD41]